MESGVEKMGGEGVGRKVVADAEKELDGEVLEVRFGRRGFQGGLLAAETPGD